MSEQLSDAVQKQMADALAAGQKIEAIKIYRAATGEGLKEAKDFVEDLVPKLVEQDPETYGKLASAKGTGCTSMLVAAFSMGLLLTLLWKQMG